MKSSMSQTRYFRPTGRRVVMALAFASLISSLSISPAFADRDDERGQGARQGNYGQREWRDDRRQRHMRRHVYQRPYSYAQPVYVPPPVYYEPQQSPGISLFFPLDFRR